MELYNKLIEQGIPEKLVEDVKCFRKEYPVETALADRVPRTETIFYGKEIWSMCITALLEGENILLSGPKATGKNVLADNLCELFGRPQWNTSFHVNTDSTSLIGTDTFIDNEVHLRRGSVYECAVNGGFGVFDEINMAKNDALVVLHSALDYRKVIDVPGYEKISLNPATRFIGTMNYE
ncbi:MAG: AAA family ATPase, partial [Eubacterium sp.]